MAEHPNRVSVVSNVPGQNKVPDGAEKCAQLAMRWQTMHTQLGMLCVGDVRAESGGKRQLGSRRRGAMYVASTVCEAFQSA